jgi:hypothetical protein
MTTSPKERSGLAARFEAQLKRGPTRIPLSRQARMAADPEAQSQKLCDTLDSLNHKIATKFSAADAKLSALERARGIQPPKTAPKSGRLSPATVDIEHVAASLGLDFADLTPIQRGRLRDVPLTFLRKDLARSRVLTGNALSPASERRLVRI